MEKLPDRERLLVQDKEALMVALWATGQRLQTRLAELEAKRQEPVKDARNSSEDDQWCLTPFSLFHATPMLGEEFRNG